MCRYRDHTHNSGSPSRQLACCTHGRSHTRSPGVPIMRVDSWELPLSAIPLCQLLPSHLGSPRPTLSINLYVKGFLHFTVGAFHMSIPAEPSLCQSEVQVFNSEPCKWLSGPDCGKSGPDGGRWLSNNPFPSWPVFNCASWAALVDMDIMLFANSLFSGLFSLFNPVGLRMAKTP